MRLEDIDLPTIAAAFAAALSIGLLILAITTERAQAQQPTTTTLQVVNARAAELFPLVGPNVRPEDKCAFQGCAEADYSARVAAIRIDRIYPWKTPPNRAGFFKTETVATCPLEADGSVACQIPCGITYQLRGVDKSGAVVAEDNSLHNAVCGETVTCFGCHANHSEEALKNVKYTAVEGFSRTIAGQKP